MNAYLLMWQAALSSPRGKRIHTTNRDLLKQRLYKARADAQDPELEQLSLVLPPNRNELWIVKRSDNTA